MLIYMNLTPQNKAKIDAMNLPMNKGDKVLVSWPNGSLTFGGTIIMVVTPQGQPTAYCVQDLGGCHEIFPATSIKLA